MGRLKISLLLSFICIASISATIITPALPYIERSFSLSNGALAWIISIFLFGYVIGQLFYGPLANRFGCLNALRGGLVVNLIGILICLGAVPLESYSLLLFGRLVTALGASGGLSCTFILINELLTIDARKTALSFATVSFTVGTGIAIVLGGLITQYLHWQDCFWLLFLHGVIMLILTWQFTEPQKTSAPIHLKAILRGYLHSFKNRQLIVFSFAVGLGSTYAYTYAAAVPIYAQGQLYLSPSQYGYWNVINMFGMIISGFLSAYLIKEYGAKAVTFLSLMLMIPALSFLSLLVLQDQSNILLFFLTTMSLYLITGLLFPAATFFASNAIADKASASSIMSFINMGSSTVSVVILGYLPFSPILSFIITLTGFFIFVAILLLQFFSKYQVSVGSQNI